MSTYCVTLGSSSRQPTRRRTPAGRGENPPCPSSLARLYSLSAPPHPSPQSVFLLLLGVLVSAGTALPAGGSCRAGSVQGGDRSQEQLRGRTQGTTSAIAPTWGPGRFPPAPSVSWFPHLESGALLGRGPPRVAKGQMPPGGVSHVRAKVPSAPLLNIDGSCLVPAQGASQCGDMVGRRCPNPS